MMFVVDVFIRAYVESMCRQSSGQKPQEGIAFTIVQSWALLTPLEQHVKQKRAGSNLGQRACEGAVRISFAYSRVMMASVWESAWRLQVETSWDQRAKEGQVFPLHNHGW